MNTHISIMSDSHTPIWSPGGESHWDSHGIKFIAGGGHFKVDEEIGLPLTQCQFYSKLILT